MTTNKWVAVDMFTGEIVTDSQISRVVLRHREIVARLAEICDMLPPLGADGQRCWNRMTKAERGMLNRCAKQLHEAGATNEQIGAFGEWWYTSDWRGLEKRQLPGPWDVVKNWSRMLNWLENTPSEKSWGVSWDEQANTPGTAAYRLAHRDDPGV